ncbi:hypothetical protein [Paracoccus sanguinis]|uniref:Glycosyl transferase family 2 n=1 Tax=Paracoccus sanguinis TaxID=1545044 RepID=A0A1H2WRW1_9RHOB|nr:hypothetical protein [Paracoccus sanguinis]KGJ16773.1 hypothetical protein IX57_10890 [Paracoccus sanguinis]SDW82719.1 hypothetical protein SAMN05444276_102231 [Paracoccus sanguinis]
MKIAAVTHVRNDDFYLGKWVDHYGRLLGRDNLHILLDGSDWQPGVDLTGTNVTVVERQITRMNRVRIDRRMARLQHETMARLFGELGVDAVIKGDVDELIVPHAGRSITEAAAQVREAGVIYSLGVDVVHNTAAEPPLDPARPVMSQRHYGVISQSYCKVNLVGREAFAAGVTVNAGGHRASAWPVHVSTGYTMLHLGFCDRGLWEERTLPRLAADREGAFKAYFDDRVRIYDGLAAITEFHALDSAAARAAAELSFDAAGNRLTAASKFSGGNLRVFDSADYAVRLDDRFEGVF